MIPVFKVVEKQPAGTASDVLFQNLICFLMNFGTECLRQLVYSTVKKADLVKLFSSGKIATEVSQLMASNRLTPEQCQMLKDNPDPEKFEISLLMLLLANENIFQLPDTVIHDLKCLREIRGGILHHLKLMSKTLFEGYLQQISRIFKRITHHVNVEKQPGMKLKLKNEKYLSRQNMQAPDSNLFLSFINWHLRDTDNYQTSLEILQLKTTILSDGNKDKPLPPSWATGDSPDGRLFYVNLDTRTASWVLNTVQDTTWNAEKTPLETVDPLSKELNKLDQNKKSRQQSSQEDLFAAVPSVERASFSNDPPTHNGTGHRYLYRVLRPNEDITQGLSPKDSFSPVSVQNHVEYGSRLYSKYISTCSNKDLALRFARLGLSHGSFSPKRIATIDVKILCEHYFVKIIDLTDVSTRSVYLSYNSRARRFAKDWGEVLVEGKIPASCITSIDEIYR